MGKRLGFLKTRFDVQSDNFELYFEKQAIGISEAGKEVMPKDIAVRIYNFDGGLKQDNIRRLSFLAKLWVLWKCLKKRIWIFVENEEDGIGVEEFVKLRDAIKKRDYGVKKAEGFTIDANFCTVNKEFGDTLAYLNNLSLSPAYNYINKGQNFKSTGTDDFKNKMNYIVRFLRFYESNKKRWVNDKSLSIPEFLVLIFLYDKEEALGSTMYRETYFRAYQSSPYKIKLAFRVLQQKGYIIKHGMTSGARMQITSMGKDVVNSILTKYALNC